MIKYLILQQLDYIFFVYGLAFILLGVVCFATQYRKVTSFPLLWLGLFGFSHGINEWLDMLVISHGDGIVFSSLRLLVMGSSFVFLLEFGRIGVQKVTGRDLGRWIYLPLLAAVWSSRSGSFTGLNVMMRYCFGLLGGGLAAFAFYRASQGKGRVGRVRRFEAVAMLLYAFAAGAIVPKAPFFPASLINHESFFDMTGIPIQLVRGVLAVFLAVGIWMHYQQLKNRRIIYKRNNETQTLYGVHLTVLLLVVLALGWAFSNHVGLVVDRDNRSKLLDIVKVAATAVSPERVVALHGTERDLASSDFLRLHDQMMNMQKVNPRIRELALLIERDGRIRDALDTIPHGSVHVKRPAAAHEESRQGFASLFETGGALTIGPYRDATGSYVTSYAAISNPADGRVVAVVGCDVKAEDWQMMVASARLLPIGMTLLLCLLFITFFVVRQRMWDSRQQIVDSERDLAAAQRIAHVGSWSYDPRDGSFEWSDEMLRICGYDPERIATVGKECLARDIDGFFSSGIKELTASGGRQEFETCLVLPNGSTRSISVAAEAVSGESGEVLRIAGTTQDITAQNLAWEQVILARDKAEQYFQLTPSAIFTVDTDKVVTSWNNAMSRATGYSAEEALGRTCGFFAESPCNEKCGLFAADVPKPIIRRECTIRHKNGSIRNILKNVDVLVDEQNLVVGGIESFEDVTERLQAETRVLETNRQLEAARRIAEAASTAKSEFLANMSHEIRTPMNAVIGITRLVMKTELTLQQREYLRKVMFAADSLLGIINDLLDFSKIEAGRMELESTHFLLEEVLGQVIDLVAEKAQEKRLELLIEPYNNVPVSLVGDPLRLSQILSNLCSNAIKFSNSGEIVISILVMHQDDGSVTLRFSVRDSGIGMSADQVGRLFQPFIQADSSTTRKYGGTGLGLAICRQLVELMGGEISVVSEPGRGSEFFFTALFGLGDMKSPRIPEPAPDLRGMRVLVVDDSTIACEIFKSQLASLSYDVGLAFSGKEGLRMVEQAGAAKRPYDLVIVDWIMPDMDGFETAQRIRAIPGLSPVPKIVMATAYGCEEATQLARSGGLDGYLTKPATLSVIFDVIMSAFGKETTERGPGFPEKGKVMQALEQIRGASALLVEDNEYNQLVASELLKSVGLFVTIAENGREALEKLGSRPFDVVLMDIQMPIMDGYEATRCIRTDPAFASLPIIAMTAHAMASDRDKCLAVGMNDYVSKPIDPDALSAVLVSWVKPGVRVAAPELSQQRVVDPDGDVLLPHTLPGVFVGAGLRMCNDNKKLYRDLLIRFKNDRYRTADEIRGALHAGDPVAAGRLAHTMKSVAGTLGAKQLSESAETLEKSISGGDLDALTLSLAEFDRCLRLVSEGLRAAFPDDDVRTAISCAAGVMAPADRLLVGQMLDDLTTLLKSDIGQAMSKMDTLRKHLPEGPLLELFGIIEQRMGEFDIDGVRERLAELSGMLDLREEDAG